MSNELKLYENNGAVVSVSGENYLVAVPGAKPVELIRSSKDKDGNDLQDGDFGVIPGTQKPSLLKPGADKIRIAYGFFERHTLIESLCGYDPNRGCMRYVDRCDLVKLNVNTGQEYVFASYHASANDMEKRNGKAAGSPTVDNNTIKMAQKRSMVSAVISVANLANLFTMDVEDQKLDKAYETIKSSVMNDKIDMKYIHKFWTEAGKAGKSKEDVAEILTSIGYDSSKDITKKDFGNVLDVVTGKKSVEEYLQSKGDADASTKSEEKA